MPKANDIVDGWTLRSRLGGGGNGDVWEAEHPEHGTAALKMLRAKGGDRWQRFRDEVHVMELLGERPGILPLVASRLPEPATKEQAWLATPIATPALEQLGEAPSLREVVTAVVAFAETLADLATLEIHHRDLKPGNLFSRNGNWEIGDFGLVAYPDKEAVTTGNRRLGPLYFLAPEMIDHPDTAAAGPVDVYSLATTLWVFATGQRFPPQGQIRTDVPLHALSTWAEGRAQLALGLILEAATDDDPAERPDMATFSARLQGWLDGGSAQEDVAVAAVTERYITRMRQQMSDTIVDPAVFADARKSFDEALAGARKESNEKEREVARSSMLEGEQRRKEWLERDGVKAALSMHESAWIGSMQGGDDFAEAVLAAEVENRAAELQRARKILLGRPLWWAHSVGLIGTLKLRGQPGCEPEATDMARQAIRDHLLEFTDHPALGAAWRLQRALIPLTARILGFAPLEQQVQALQANMSAEERARYRLSAGKLMMIQVGEIVRTKLRTVQWTPDALNNEASEAESQLEQIPIPTREWEGPMGDAWLQSWRVVSPLKSCGLAILATIALGDDLIVDEDVLNAISEAAGSEHHMLGSFGRSLSARLQHQAQVE